MLFMAPTKRSGLYSWHVYCFVYVGFLSFESLCDVFCGPDWKIEVIQLGCLRLLFFGWFFMASTVGYFVTWTTYGSWLPGDRRGYVCDGKVLEGDEVVFARNQSRLVKDPVRFNREQKGAVKKAILAVACQRGDAVEAVSVWSNHVHVVVRYSGREIEDFVAQCKTAGRQAVGYKGLNGKVWTIGFYNRFCFDEVTLRQKVAYVLGHGD